MAQVWSETDEVERRHSSSTLRSLCLPVVEVEEVSLPPRDEVEGDSYAEGPHQHQQPHLTKVFRKEGMIKLGTSSKCSYIMSVRCRCVTDPEW